MLQNIKQAIWAQPINQVHVTPSYCSTPVEMGSTLMSEVVHVALFFFVCFVFYFVLVACFFLNRGSSVTWPNPQAPCNRSHRQFLPCDAWRSRKQTTSTTHLYSPCLGCLECLPDTPFSNEAFINCKPSATWESCLLPWTLLSFEAFLKLQTNIGHFSVLTLLHKPEILRTLAAVALTYAKGTVKAMKN